MMNVTTIFSDVVPFTVYSPIVPSNPPVIPVGRVKALSQGIRAINSYWCGTCPFDCFCLMGFFFCI